MWYAKLTFILSGQLAAGNSVSFLGVMYIATPLSKVNINVFPTPIILAAAALYLDLEGIVELGQSLAGVAIGNGI